MTNEPPKRRRWFQFRLRTLLIAVLVLSLPLSWFAVRMERARKQREVVEAIREAGGSVLYDWQHDIDGTRLRPESSWLRDLLGDDYFDSVVCVSFSPYYAFHQPDSDVPPAKCVDISGGRKAVVQLSTIKFLDLTSTSVTDEDIDWLPDITGLRFLVVMETQITPEGVKKLEEALPNCEIDY